MAKNAFGDEIVEPAAAGQAAPSKNVFGDEVVQSGGTPEAMQAAPTKTDKTIPYLSSIGDALSSEASGIRDAAIEGPAQLLTHVLPDPVLSAGNHLNNWLRDKGVPLPELPERNLASQVTGKTNLTLDDYEKQREENIQRERAMRGDSGPDVFRAAGSAMSPTNYVLPGAAETTLGRIGLGAAGGALSGALNPVPHGDFWKEKAEQTAVGAGAGGGVGAAGEAVTSLIAPRVQAAAHTLLENGLSLTPGQTFGGVAKRAEEGLKSVPILGSAIRSGERNALESFNRATVNRSLEPIGAQLPAGITAGHEAIAEGQHILGRAYDDLLPNLHFGMDQQFGSDIQGIRQVVSEMPAPQAEQFENILRNRLGTRAGPDGQMDGETLKQVQSELTHLANTYRTSGDAAQRYLGYAIGDVNTAMRDALERQNPEYAPQLRNVNRAYAAFARVEGAANRRATAGGLFTPGDLLQSIKNGDKTARKRAFAAGDAMMQDWAESAHRVLGNTMPDSGTTERLLWAGGAGGLLFHNPLVAAGAVAGAAPYTQPGMDLLRSYVTAAPEARAQLAEAIRNSLTQAPASAGAIAGSTEASAAP